MSFWPFRKINEHKNCVVNSKSKFQNNANDNSKENVFESKPKPKKNENSCTEEYLDFPICCGVMERLKGGHYLKDISHGCQPENVEGGIRNLAKPNKNQTQQSLTLNGSVNPKEFKGILRELGQDSCSNSVKALEQKSKLCFENATVQQFLGRIDLGDMYPLDVYYVEVPPNEQAFKLEEERESKADTERNFSSLVETNVSRKQENQFKKPQGETSSAKYRQKRFSINSHGDINRESRQTCQPIKYCCKPLDCTQPMLHRCTLSKEDPTCSNKADKCKELKDYLKRVKDKQQCDVDQQQQQQQNCKPTKYCCERVDFKEDCCCGCKKPIIYRCMPYPSDPPCTEKSKVCKELEDYLKSVKNVKRESSYKNQEERVSQSGRSSFRKTNEYKGIENETSSAKKSFNNSKGNGNNARTSQIQRPSGSLDNQNGRSSLRNFSEYKQQKDSLKIVGEEIPRESSNNNQRISSLRGSQAYPPDKPLDIKNGRSSVRKSNEYKQQKYSLKGVENEAPIEPSNNKQRDSNGRPSQAQPPDKYLDVKNGRSSLRKSNEYKQQKDSLKGFEDEAPIESSNNSQRDSSGRASQAQPPDQSLDLQNGRSRFGKSNQQQENYIKTDDEITSAENIQRGSSNNSQEDARVFQTSQYLKTFDQKDDNSSLEDTKRSVSEDASETCKPIKFSCKRLDCTQYPPCMIKSKGYKQPAVFSCRLCGPKETVTCSDRSGVCKELEDYLQSIRKKRIRESLNKNQADQPKEAFDPQKDRPSLRKSNEYKQENGVEEEILPNKDMPDESPNNNQGDASGRASENYQPVEMLGSEEVRPSLRKSNEYKQREDASGRISQPYQPVETLDSTEGRSSLRKSNEYSQRESYVKGDTSSAKTVPTNQEDANGRVSQSYQPVETLDSKEGRSSSMRKSNEEDNYVKTERENIQRGSTKSSQGDARVSQASQVLNDFDHKEDTCSSREDIAPDNNVSEQAPEASQASKYCCEPVDLTKCQPCLMKTNAGKLPRIYRCWPYDQDTSSKRKSNTCSEKTNECKPPVICCCKPSTKKCKEFECKIPCKDEHCLMKIKTCKIPDKCCCKPCQPKLDPCCPKKTNKCKEPIKYRSRPCDSKEDSLDSMKTQLIKQLIEYLKDLKVQLTSVKMIQKDLFNTNKSDVKQNGSHTCPCKRASQVKRMSDKDSSNVVENNGCKQNEIKMPSQSCDARQQEKIKDVTSPITNTLRKSSDMGQKETPNLPATLLQQISSDTVQPNVVVCCKRKKGGCTPSKNKLNGSADSCKCQEYKPFDPKLDASSSKKTKLLKPHDNNVKDIKEEIPQAKALQNYATTASKPDFRDGKEDSPISKNILSGRLDSKEKGSQTEQPNNTQSAKAPYKHTLNIAPISLTIPLKLVIDTKEGQSNIIEADIIVEATSGAQNQGRSMAVSKTAMPMPNSNISEGFFSCLSEPAEVEVKKLSYVKPQLKSSMAHPKTPLNKTTYMIDSNGSDGFFSCLSGSSVMEVGTVNAQNKCDTTPNKTPLNKTTHMQDDSDSDVFFPCLSESDVRIAKPAATVKPQNIVELEQQVKEGSNSCTIIPTTVPPVSKSKNQQTETESEKPFKTLVTSEPKPEVKQVEGQTLPTPITQTPLNVMHVTLEEQTLPKAVTQTQPNILHVTLPEYVEPKSGDNAKSARYSTPIDYQGIPVKISKRGRSQSKSAEPAVADKATATSYISGRQLRNEMRTEIQEQLKELIELPDTNAKHKYDAQERNAILLELHKLFNPEMVDLVPQEIIREITLTSIRYLVEPELLSSTDKEIAKLSEHQARILEDIRHIINPKSGQSDGARKFHKESKFKILEDLRIILSSRRQERSSDADIRKNILNDLRSQLDSGEVPSTCPAKDTKCQQRSPDDIKESLMSDLKHLLDAAANLQAENKENQGTAVKKESLSNNSSDEPLIDSNIPIITRKVQTAPPRRTFASIVMPKRYSQRFSTPERRKTYRDLQSSSSEDFFLDLHDD